MSDHNSSVALERVAKRLREEGDALIAQGRVKLMAAEAIEAEIPSQQHSAADGVNGAQTTRVRARASTAKSGWSEFVRANVGATPVSVDDLLAIANREGRWSDLSDPTRRTRIRTTLHTLKDRELQQLEDGRWKTA